MLLNDKVSFRMHWPSCPDLRINGTMHSISHSMIKDSVLVFLLLRIDMSIVLFWSMDSSGSSEFSVCCIGIEE